MGDIIMHVQSHKINLFLVISICVSASLLAADAKDTSSIKQVSKERIQKHSRHIRGVMNRRNIMTKLGIAGISAYALYTISFWIRSRSHNNSHNREELTGSTLEELLQNQNRLQAQLTRVESELSQLHGFNDLNKTGWQKAWDRFKNTGQTIFQWIGVPLLIGTVSNKFYNFMGFTQSIDVFDQNVTHCMELLQYLVYNIQEVAEFIGRTGQEVSIDKKDFVRTLNRLINSVEKMIGFMHAKRSDFADELNNEAKDLAERLTEYAQEFAKDLQDELTSTTDFRQIAQTVAHFGQCYAQEKQRFALIEQEA